VTLLVFSRGVRVGVANGRVFMDGIVVRLYLADFEVVTSSPKSARLRLLRDLRMFGSTFSESELSGEACRLFKEGAKGVERADLCKFISLRKVLCKPTILTVLDALEAAKLGAI
jgi:hypothetical protein